MKLRYVAVQSRRTVPPGMPPLSQTVDLLILKSFARWHELKPDVTCSTQLLERLDLSWEQRQR